MAGSISIRHYSVNLDCTAQLTRTVRWNIEQCLDSLCLARYSVDDTNKLTLAFSELYVPTQFLAYGDYRMTLNAFGASMNIFVKIIASPLLVRLVPFDVRSIRQGQQQTLLLDPGSYSTDPDQTSFHPTVRYQVLINQMSL